MNDINLDTESENRVELLKISLGEIYEPNKSKTSRSIQEIIKNNKNRWIYIDNCQLYRK